MEGHLQHQRDPPAGGAGVRLHFLLLLPHLQHLKRPEPAGDPPELLREPGRHRPSPGPGLLHLKAPFSGLQLCVGAGGEKRAGDRGVFERTVRGLFRIAAGMSKTAAGDDAVCTHAPFVPAAVFQPSIHSLPPNVRSYPHSSPSPVWTSISRKSGPALTPVPPTAAR